MQPRRESDFASDIPINDRLGSTRRNWKAKALDNEPAALIKTLARRRLFRCEELQAAPTRQQPGRFDFAGQSSRLSILGFRLSPTNWSQLVAKEEADICDVIGPGSCAAKVQKLIIREDLPCLEWHSTALVLIAAVFRSLLRDVV